ncbi:hypothetical protein BT63DRAFT_460677 [Microthyrium microscopicum]|uniref:BTB domain-containing protein n=1 Tax=Microthyrium microscopicum TaxID=703497 RepID=A0A6A6TYY2_9PEZI|nr:hypothetical protein BT63DRAFT_460677 [Microthyrium microscopicum]
MASKSWNVSIGSLIYFGKLNHLCRNTTVTTAEQENTVATFVGVMVDRNALVPIAPMEMADTPREPRKSSRLQVRNHQFCFRTQFKDFEATARVLVGPQSTPFLMHKELLCTHSPFFAAALNGSFAEATSQTVTLADVEPKHFEHVVLWFYTQRLENTEYFYKDGKPTYFALLDIYSLADRLTIEGMRNAIVDRMAELAERTNSVPTPSDTYILYETIRDNAPIRRLILDLFAFKKTDNLVATHPDEWHPSFLRELVCKLKRPGYVSLKRHDVRPWRPSAWPATKACAVCSTVIKPLVSANMCVVCEKAFCCLCIVRGESGGALDWTLAEKECKPWLRGMCAYHEHGETEVCRGR